MELIVSWSPIYHFNYESQIMHIELYRNYYRQNYIIGKLFIDDDYFCDTLEPMYREINGAIPVGTYKVSLDIVSPKFQNRFPYKTLCHGRVPRVLGVPGRQGVLLHVGNFPQDSQGCILLGKNTKVGAVLQSLVTFTNFYNKIKDSIYLDITISDVPLDKESKDVLESFNNKNEIEIPQFP